MNMGKRVWLACTGILQFGVKHGWLLQKLLDGKAKDWTEDIFLQIGENQVRGSSIRTKEQKYYVRGPGKSGLTHADSDSKTIEDNAGIVV